MSKTQSNKSLFSGNYQINRNSDNYSDNMNKTEKINQVDKNIDIIFEIDEYKNDNNQNYQKANFDNSYFNKSERSIILKGIKNNSEIKDDSDFTNKDEKKEIKNFNKNDNESKFEKSLKSKLSSRLKTFIKKKKEILDKEEISKNVEVISNEIEKEKSVIKLDDKNKQKIISNLFSNNSSNKKIKKFYFFDLFKICPKPNISKIFIENENNYQKFLTKIKNTIEMTSILSTQKNI